MVAKQKDLTAEKEAAGGVEAPAVITEAKASTVTVYCNLPCGLTWALSDGRALTVKGYPVSRLVGAEGEALPAGKYGVTPGVPRDDWAYVEKTYRESAYMQAGLVFASADPEYGAAQAAEMAETRHGMEQANVWKRGDDRRLPAGKTEPEAR